jgi:hypothetical protein
MPLMPTFMECSCKFSDVSINVEIWLKFNPAI